MYSLATSTAWRYPPALVPRRTLAGGSVASVAGGSGGARGPGARGRSSWLRAVLGQRDRRPRVDAPREPVFAGRTSTLSTRVTRWRQWSKAASSPITETTASGCPRSSGAAAAAARSPGRRRSRDSRPGRREAGAAHRYVGERNASRSDSRQARMPSSQRNRARKRRPRSPPPGRPELPRSRPAARPTKEKRLQRSPPSTDSRRNPGPSPTMARKAPTGVRRVGHDLAPDRHDGWSGPTRGRRRGRGIPSPWRRATPASARARPGIAHGRRSPNGGRNSSSPRCGTPRGPPGRR